MSRVLIVGDIHAPCMAKGYPEFCADLYDQWSCDRVVMIGDLVDWCSISYHPKAPSLKNSEVEFVKAKKQVARLAEYFPVADWLIGNHDSLTERQATDLNLPLDVLKGYTDLWDLPGWIAHPRFHDLVIDGVVYRHGDKELGGQFAAWKNAKANFRSVVQGHLHSQANVAYYACKAGRVFGMQVGCGVDWRAAAMSYGKAFAAKPILAAGVVIDGVSAVVEPMIK